MGDPLSLPLTSGVFALFGAMAILVWRVRESQRPVTLRSLIVPPLGISTGFSMFVVPAFRIPWTWGLTAFVLGAGLFAYPLIATSRLRRDGEQVMMTRSRWFLLILIGLVALRFALREYVGNVLTPPETAGLFFVLAFGMIVRERRWFSSTGGFSTRLANVRSRKADKRFKRPSPQYASRLNQAV